MNEIKVHYGPFNPPIRITQATLQYGLQEWLETIFLIADEELPGLNNWTVGYYHCKHCNTYQGFAYRLEEDKPNVKAHNEQLDFMLVHAHGDGRIALFEKHLEEKE